MSKPGSVSSLVIAILAGFSTAAAAQQHDNNLLAMTWSAWRIDNVVPDATIVGCSGCNSYGGDTYQDEERRILCAIPANNPQPPRYASYMENLTGLPNWRYYYGWTENNIGLTRKVLGTEITSKAVGDGFCTEQFGDGTRMLSFTENGVGAWAVAGRIHPKSKAKRSLTTRAGGERFWLYRPGQAANLWD